MVNFSNWLTTEPLLSCTTDELSAKSELKNTEVPKDFKLHQNYPNPFNPVTNIKFDIPAGNPHGITTLKIYDILGRAVSVIVDQSLTPGTYEVSWDASDYSSGVYFYRLFYEDHSLTKKLVLLK